jgi:3-hydroxyisobutyrate dehydrogenase-like beta-hydroxyacid dehydrogenase
MELGLIGLGKMGGDIAQRLTGDYSVGQKH